MAFIYNLSDTWNDAATTWNGIKLAVTNTGSSASSNLLNLTVTGATTASFVVDKSGNLALNGTVNKITFTAPATAATLTLADNSTFITSGAYSSTFTFTGATTLTFPTSGTVTALGNTTTGSGSIVLATSPTLVTPALGTPSSVTLTNATGLPISGISATGTPSITTYLRGDGSWATLSGGGSVTSVGQTFTGGLISVSGSPVTTTGTLALTVAGTSGGVPYFSSSSTWASSGALTANALVIGGGAGAAPSTTATGTGILTFLGTPSSANLAAAVTDETGSGSLVFSTAPTFGTNITVGTASSSTGIVNLKGTTSGTVGLSVADAAGTWTLKLPTTAGTNGYALTTDGTGATTWTQLTGSGTVNSGTSGQLAYYASSSNAISGNANVTVSSAALTLGVQSSTQGSLVLANTNVSAFPVTVKSSNTNGSSWALTLPDGPGTNGYVLSTDGTGVTSWIATSGGGGTVTSVSQTFTGGLISVSGSPITGSGTLALTVAGTSGGIPYFSSASTWATSAALAANAIVVGGGAGSAPSTITTGTGVVTALGVNTGSAGAFVVNGGALGTPSSGTLTNCTSIPVNQATGVLPVANGGTNASSASITAFNNITGYTASGATGTTSTNLVFSTSPTITTPTISGNETHTGTAARFIADFDNVTVNSRFAFQTSTTNADTGIYALPNGSSTGAAWQAANAADPTNASKIMIVTNASTDVQLVSGRNGSGAYLPLSIYTGGGVSAQFSATKGIFTLGVSGSTAGVLNIAGSTSGTISIQGAAGAGTYNFNLPTGAGTSGQPLLSGGGGATSMTFGTLGVSGGGTGASSASITAFNNITGYTAAGATGTTSTNLVFSTSPTLVTPVLGAATATSINGLTITSSTGTLTVTNGKTASFSNTITLAATNDSQTYTLPAATCNIGYLEVPQNSQSASYTAVLADSGKQIFHPSTDNNARTFTIPANGSVAYPIGTVLTFVNMANTVTIAITTDTMYLAGTGTTGSRSLAAYGVATAVKMTSTTWLISGTGLT
jgi:hypothetical protein